VTHVNAKTEIELRTDMDDTIVPADTEVVVESRLINRELANLDFQERVFALAESPERPLLERIKFVAIVSSNLDEFFQVRVAGLLEQAASGVTAASPDGLNPKEQLEAIRLRVIDLNARIDDLFVGELVPALDAEGIHIVDYDELSHEDRERLNEIFEENIFPVLTPLAVDTTHPFPFISDLSLNLAVLLRNQEGGLQFARVKIPPNVPRFVAIDHGERFVPLEQVVGNHLGRLFGGLDVVDHYAFRVTRSADLDVEEVEADDLLEAMESVLRYRHRSAHAVRLEVEQGIGDHVLDLLLHGLQLTETEVYYRTAPLGLAGLWNIYALNRPNLKDPDSPATAPHGVATFPAVPTGIRATWLRISGAFRRLMNPNRS
jgi:polyphosphate kinase